MNVPEVYEFDDTPKRFTRMIKQKDQIKNKNSKTIKNLISTSEKLKPINPNIVRKGESFDEYNERLEKISLQASNKKKEEDKINFKSSKSSIESFSEAKTIRPKRKLYLQKRDKKDQMKKFLKSSSKIDPIENLIIKDTKKFGNYAQEPPILSIKPKKVFKKEVSLDQSLKKLDKFQEDIDYCSELDE
jgi:hypothetical protein